MNIKRLICGIVILILGISSKLLGALGVYPIILDASGIPLLVLGVFLIVYAFNWSKHGFQNEKERVLNVTEQEKIALLRYAGLNKNSVLHVYYSEDGKSRILIYKLNTNGFSYAKERLTIFDEDEIIWSGVYGVWEDVSVRKSIFEDEKLVLNDIKNELINYYEEFLD